MGNSWQSTITVLLYVGSACINHAPSSIFNLRDNIIRRRSNDYHSAPGQRFERLVHQWN